MPSRRPPSPRPSYTEKQHFLNAVYEKFFQHFDTKQADTMGIVYTPQPIVDFMVRSVDEILQQEFGKTLSDKGVHILDPFTGTGNFITRIMQQIKRSALPQKYAEELHCNEIMLLPYYIASMNIEHAYMERAGQYESFEGICLVDTFEMTEGQQATLFNADNTKRVRRQKEAEIRVVIGNPPYNAGQKKENDANKNRKYPILDKLVQATFGKRSRATLQTKLRDPYVRAIRWGLNRLEGRDGVVAFVTNGSFVDDNTFDGLRACLKDETSKVYCIDLGGNIIKHPSLSGTTHNVFGIQVNVAITFFVRRGAAAGSISYASLPWDWRTAAKENWLRDQKSLAQITWRDVTDKARQGWAVEQAETDFEQLVPFVSAKADKQNIFSVHGLGVSTNRDPVAYNFGLSELFKSAQKFTSDYNRQVERIALLPRDTKIDEFTQGVDSVVWSERLKQRLKARRVATFDAQAIANNLYRPFTKKLLYYGEGAVDRPSILAAFSDDRTNPSLLVPALGGRSQPWCLASNIMPNLNLVSVDAVQVFPFFYDEERGSRRRENITDSALSKFRSHFEDETISKWDIFHATYAVLHHPEYRTRYAANLKRELPRIPFPPDFHAFAAAGKRLMELHIDYEKQPEYHNSNRSKTPKPKSPSASSA